MTRQTHELKTLQFRNALESAGSMAFVLIGSLALTEWLMRPTGIPLQPVTVVFIAAIVASWFQGWRSRAGAP
jgi:hypothetical protein